MGELADAFDQAMKDLFDLVAPEDTESCTMTWVDGGVETDFRAIIWSTTSAADQEGLAIDAAGMRNQQTLTVLFYKTELDAVGVTIAPTGHAVYLGERWDLKEDEPIQDKLVSFEGLHNLVQVILRKSVELNKSVDVAEFTIAD